MKWYETDQLGSNITQMQRGWINSDVANGAHQTVRQIIGAALNASLPIIGDSLITDDINYQLAATIAAGMAEVKGIDHLKVIEILKAMH